MSTEYIDPTVTQIRIWIGRGLCGHCGKMPDSGDRCVCRECTSCSQIWIADRLADYADTDHGPQPRKEYCPECVAAGEIKHG